MNLLGTLVFQNMVRKGLSLDLLIRKSLSICPCQKASVIERITTNHIINQIKIPLI
jgi:hypothetical protein